MASIPTIPISGLTEQTTPADGDFMVIGGTDAKKIKWANLTSTIKKMVFGWVYPVGTIYFTVDNANPGNKFGGTWIAWGAGRIPVGVNASDTDFSKVEEQGGNKSNTHNHFTYWCNENGTVYAGQTSDVPRSRVRTKDRSANTILPAIYNSVAREDSTYDETISIMPPYITCYMWKRTE